MKVSGTRKLQDGIENLTSVMKTDFEEASNLQNLAQAKLLQVSKLEKLRKFIGHVASIDISEIKDDDNVRQSLNTSSEDFQALYESIAKNGIQQNLVIDFIETNNECGYELKCVAGHRRLAAARILGLKTAPCLIKTFKNASDKLEIALAENLLREDLHFLDIADGYQRLLNYGWSKENIEKYFDRNQKTIRYYLKMASWPASVKELIRNNPDKLTGRLITRKYACRKFEDETELYVELDNELSVNKKPKGKDKTISLSSKIQGYLEAKGVNKEIKKIIWEMLLDLQIVKDAPLKKD